MSHTATDATPEDLDDERLDGAGDLFDEEWLSAAPRRSRARMLLLGGLVVAVSFLGGVQVQRHYGASDSAGTSSGGLPAGMPDGFPAGGAFPGGTTGGSATGSGQGGGAESSADAQVIGTLVAVQGDTWTVKDLGGTKHTITVDAETRIVREEQVDPADVPTGATVDVSGAAGGSGDVTATTITIR
jgi:hypothetical protein